MAATVKPNKVLQKNATLTLNDRASYILPVAFTQNKKIVNCTVAVNSSRPRDIERS